MLHLNNIELLAISSDKPIETIRSIRYTTLNIKFKSVKFLTHLRRHEINTSTDNIELVNISQIKSHKEYNDFCLSITNYTSSEFVLIVQNDSFVTNYKLWTDDFLNYDYIGAPWTEQQQKDWNLRNRVGNGGFSLRSKKFLDYSSKFENCRGANEDGFLTNFTYDSAIQFGINYAPIDLAQRFSIEKILDTYNPDEHFGFHGSHIYNQAEDYIKNKFYYEKCN